VSDIPRPKRHLIAMSRRYPDAWRLVDEMRADRGTRLPDWPEWCFLPAAGAYAIVSRGRMLSPLDPEIEDIARVAALAAWRVTQGIYRFDPDLYRALRGTPVEGDLPVDIILRLPEWCVYIETPGYMFGADPLHGFFAHLEHDANDRRIELRFLLDFGDDLDDLLPLPLHMSGDVAASLAAMAEEANRQAERAGMEIPPEAFTAPGQMVPYVTPLVSLVLYLCSTAAEYIGDRRPTYPRPVRTKRGPRIFPPDQPTVWQTGFRIGAALRRAENERRRSSDEGETTDRRSPRPHIRCAHWHAYWTGPRSEPAKRRVVLHWLPPIPVNVGDLDDIAPTVRSVKPRKEERREPLA